MGKIGGFLEIARVEQPERNPAERLHDFNEFVETLPADGVREQGARCIECGVPFCHNGCPLGNLIPDWNDLVYRDRWREAIDQLHATNNFPEFTGRLCPAPCEAACVLSIHSSPVAIEEIEKHTIEIAFAKGYVQPTAPVLKSGKTVAVVGSGPAGLAAADPATPPGAGSPAPGDVGPRSARCRARLTAPGGTRRTARARPPDDRCGTAPASAAPGTARAAGAPGPATAAR